MSDSRDPRMNEAMEDVRELQESAAASFFALEDSLPDNDGTPTPPSSAPPREREGETLASVLREHWLVELRCNHDAKTDEAACSCALWGSGPRSSVGEAVAAWADHVVAMLALDRAASVDLSRQQRAGQPTRIDMRIVGAAASLPPSAGTMEPEYVDGVDLLRRIRHEPLLRAAYNLGRYDLGRQQPSSAPSAGTRETDQRFDDPVEQIIATLEGGPTVADARKPLALRITHAIRLLRKLHPKSAPPSAGTRSAFDREFPVMDVRVSAPPSAGSGETELEEMRCALRDVIQSAESEADRSGRFAYYSPKHNGWAGIRLQRLLEYVTAQRDALAAHPAGPTRAEEGE